MSQMKMIIVSVMLVTLLIEPGQSTSWNYDDSSDYGPSNWATNIPDYCSGSSQSPINIITEDLVTNAALSDLTFIGDEIDYDDMTFENNGHSVSFTMEDDPDFPLAVNGGGLAHTYTLNSFHFHWGKSGSSMGSEHTVNGEAHEGEIHIIFYNSDLYSSYSDAIASGDSDALAVFAIFINLGEENSYLDFLISSIVFTQDAGDVYTFDDDEAFYLSSFINSIDTSNIYRYSGSLTTPTCNEIITWTVFQQPTTLSEDQLSYFYELNNSLGDDLISNYRPVQPLNGRTVYSST